MRVVEFDGDAVKRQKKIGANKILVVFYDRPPIVVTPAEWAARSANRYYSGDVRRRDVVRQHQCV
jgi:hypothetical protein